MARSSECTEQHAQKVIDTADIVREAIFRHFRLAWPTAKGRKPMIYEQRETRRGVTVRDFPNCVAHEPGLRLISKTGLRPGAETSV
jgi:hypothetical protein